MEHKDLQINKSNSENSDEDNDAVLSLNSSVESVPLNYVFELEGTHENLILSESESLDESYNYLLGETVESKDDNSSAFKNAEDYSSMPKLTRIKSLDELSEIPRLQSRSKSFDFDSVKVTKDEETERLKDKNKHLRETVKMLQNEIIDSPANNNDLKVLQDMLQTKEAIISELSEQNKDLSKQIAIMHDGSFQEEVMDQARLISELKIECAKKDNEIERLKAVESNSKQTKQVLKDITWTLRVKEEELKNIKIDMRENYEKRMNELMQRLNDRDYKLTSLHNQNNALIESESDHILRIDELSQQVYLLQEEVDTNSDLFRQLQFQISVATSERDQLALQFTSSTEASSKKLKEMEIKLKEYEEAAQTDTLGVEIKTTESQHKNDLESLTRSFNAQLSTLQKEVNDKDVLTEELNNKLSLSMQVYDDLKQALDNEDDKTQQLTATLRNVEAEKANVKEEFLFLLDQSTDASGGGEDNYLQQQLDMLRKDKSNLQTLVTEKDLQLASLEESSENKIKQLSEEIENKKSQISELVLLLEGVSTNSDMLPMSPVDVVVNAPIDSYLLKRSKSNDSFGSIEDLNSQSEADLSDGAASLKHQMNHTITKYEKQIMELQLLYDQDISVLEKEKEDLTMQVKDLMDKFDNITNSNTMSSLNVKDLKASYEEKISSLKDHYGHLLQQASAHKENESAEKEKLQHMLEKCKERYRKQLQEMEEEFANAMQLQAEDKAEAILANQEDSATQIKLELQKELNLIKAQHEQELLSIEKNFRSESTSKQSELDETFSNHMFALHEEQNFLQSKVKSLEEELNSIQVEYDALKTRYDTLSLVEDENKLEIQNLTRTNLLLLEENKLYESTAHTRNNENNILVEGLNQNIQDLALEIEEKNKNKNYESTANVDKNLEHLNEVEKESIPRTSTVEENSNAFHQEIQMIRSNLDEAKNEVKHLYEERDKFSSLSDVLNNELESLKAQLQNQTSGPSLINDDDDDDDNGNGTVMSLYHEIKNLKEQNASLNEQLQQSINIKKMPAFSSEDIIEEIPLELTFVEPVEASRYNFLGDLDDFSAINDESYFAVNTWPHNENENPVFIKELEEIIKEKTDTEIMLNAKIEELTERLSQLSGDNNQGGNSTQSSTQELKKQDGVIKDLQGQLSTNDQTNEHLQEVFSRQVMKLQEQNDDLLKEVELHKEQEKEYSEALQAKLELEKQLEIEKMSLVENEIQLKEVQNALANERHSLNKVHLMLEQLEEALVNKQQDELLLQKENDKLQSDLENLQNSYKTQENKMAEDQENNRKIITQKDEELMNLQNVFTQKESEWSAYKDNLKKEYEKTLEMSQEKMSNANAESMSQLRKDLDQDHDERLRVLEDTLHQEYEKRINRLKDEHQQEISDLMHNHEVSSSKSKDDLEAEHKKQLETIKSVLERTQLNEVNKLHDMHNKEIEEIKLALKMEYNVEMEELQKRLDESHNMEVNMLKESAQLEGIQHLEAMKLEYNQLKEDGINSLRESMKKNFEDEKEKHKEQYNAELKNLENNLKMNYDESFSAEISKISDKYQQEKNELLGVHDGKLKDAVRLKVEEFEIVIKELELKHEREMKTLNTDLEDKNANEVMKIISDLKSEQSVYFDAKVEEIKKEYAKELETKEKFYENKLSHKDTESKLGLENLEQAHHLTLENLKEKHHSAVDEYETNFKQKSEKLENEKENLNISLKNIEEFYEQTILQKQEKLKHEFQTHLNEQSELNEREIEQMKLNQKEEIKMLERQNEANINELHEQHALKIAALQEAHSNAQLQKEMEVMDSFEKIQERRSAEEDLHLEIHRLTKQHVLDIENLNNKHEETLDNALAELRSTMNSVYNDEYEQLKQNHQLQLQTLSSECEKKILKLQRDTELKRLKEMSSLHTVMVLKHAHEIAERDLEHKLEKDNVLTKMLETEYNSKNEIERLTTKLSDGNLANDQLLKKFQSEVEFLNKQIKNYENQIALLKKSENEMCREFDIISSGSVDDNNADICKSLEASMEKIAEEYVVLAIQKSVQDVSSENPLDIDSSKVSMQTEGNIAESNIKPIDEDLYVETYEAETFSFEKDNFSKEQSSQTEMQLNRIEVLVTEPSDKEDRNNVIEEYAEEIAVLKLHILSISEQAQCQIDKLQNELATLESGKVEKDDLVTKDESCLTEEEKEETDIIKHLKTELQNLQNDIDILLNDKNNFDNEICKMKNAHIKELHEAEEKMNDEIMKKVKVATENRLNEFENAKFELMKQHQNLLDEFVQEQENQIKELKNEHTTELEQIKKDYQQHLDELKTEFENKAMEKNMGSMEGEPAKTLNQSENKEHQLEDLKNKFLRMKQEEEELKSSFEKHLNSLQNEHQEELANCKEVTRLQIEQEHLRNLAALEKGLEEKHIEQLQNLSDFQQKHISGAEDLKKEHNDIVNKIRADYENKIQQLTLDFQQLKAVEIDAVNSGIEHEIETSKQQLEMAHQQEIGALQSQLQASESRLKVQEESKENMKTIYNENLNQLKSEYKLEMEQLKEAMDQSNHLRHLESSLKDEQKSTKFQKHFEKLKEEYQTITNNLNNEISRQNKLIESFQNVSVNVESQTESSVEVLEDQLSDLQISNSQLQERIQSIEAECNQLREKLSESTSQTEIIFKRHEREEEESSNLVQILQNDVEKASQEKKLFQEQNIQLTASLSHFIDAAIKAEGNINKKIDDLIIGHAQYGTADLTQLMLSPSHREKTPQNKTPSMLVVEDVIHENVTPDNTLVLQNDFSMLTENGNGEEVFDQTNQLHVDTEKSMNQTNVDDQDKEELIDQTSRLFGIDINNPAELKDVGARVYVAVEHLLQMLETTTTELGETHTAYDEMSKRADVNKQTLVKLETENKYLAERLGSADLHINHYQSSLETIQQKFDEIAKDKEELEERKKDLQEQLNSIEERVLSIQNENNDVIEKKVMSEKECADLQRECQHLKEQLKKEGAVIEKLNVKCDDMCEERKHLLEEKKLKEVKLAELKTELENERYARKQDNIEMPRKASKTSFDLDQENEKLKQEVIALNEIIEEMMDEKEGLRSQLLDSGYSGKEESVNLRKDLTKIMDEKDDLILQINELVSQVKQLQEALKETIHEKQVLEEEYQKGLELKMEDGNITDSIKDNSQHLTTDVGSDPNFEKLVEEIVLLPIQCDPLSQLESFFYSDEEDPLLVVEKEELNHEGIKDNMGKSSHAGEEDPLYSVEVESLHSVGGDTSEHLGSMKNNEGDNIITDKATEAKQKQKEEVLVNMICTVKQLIEDKEDGSNEERVVELEGLLQKVEQLHAEVTNLKHQLMLEVNPDSIIDDIEVLKEEVQTLKDQVADQNQDSNKLLEEMGNKNSLIAQLENALSVEENKFLDIRRQLFTKEEECEKINNELSSGRLQLKEKENGISTLTSQVHELQNTIKQRQNTIEQLQNSLEKQLTRTTDLSRLHADSKAQLKYIKELENELSARKDILNDKNKELEALKAQLNEDIGALSELQAQLTAERDQGDGVNCHQLQDELETSQLVANDLKAELDTHKKEAREKDDAIIEKEIELRKKDAVLAEKEALINEKDAEVARLRNLEPKLTSVKEAHAREIETLKDEIKRLSEVCQDEKSSDETVLPNDDAERLINLLRQKLFMSGSQNNSTMQGNSVKLLLSDLQNEADEVLDLVLNYPENNADLSPEDIRKLQAAWAREKEGLLGVIKSLRDLIAETGNENPTSSSNIHGRRGDVVEDLFENEQNVLLAELDSMGAIHNDTTIAAGVAQAQKQKEVASALLSSLVSKDGDLLLQEITALHSKINGMDSANRDFQEHINELEKELVDLKGDLDAKELKCAQSEERIRLGENAIEDYSNALTRERQELNEEKSHLQMEIARSNKLSNKLNDSENNIKALQKILEDQRKNLQDKFLHDHSVVGELEQLLQVEIEKRELLDQKLEKESLEKESVKSSHEAQKQKLLQAEQSELNLKQKQVELAEMLQKERKDKKTIAKALENAQKVLDSQCEELNEVKAASRKNDELKVEFDRLKRENKALKGDVEKAKYTSEKAAKLHGANKKLKALEDDLNVREKLLESKEVKLESLVAQLEDEEAVLQERQKSREDMKTVMYQQNNEIEALNFELKKEQMKHLDETPIVKRIKNLEEENADLRDSLSTLSEQVKEFEKQESDNVAMATKWNEEQTKLHHMIKELKGKLKISGNDDISEDGRKLIQAGWTIAKVQRLYLKYFRAESFRKSLAYQKRYILLLLSDYQQGEQSVLVRIASLSGPPTSFGRDLSVKKTGKFKIAVRAVIAVCRMKYLVRKYQRNLYKSSPEYKYKERFPSESKLVEVSRRESFGKETKAAPTTSSWMLSPTNEVTTPFSSESSDTMSSRTDECTKNGTITNGYEEPNASKTDRILHRTSSLGLPNKPNKPSVRPNRMKHVSRRDTLDYYPSKHDKLKKQSESLLVGSQGKHLITGKRLPTSSFDKKRLSTSSFKDERILTGKRLSSPVESNGRPNHLTMSSMKPALVKSPPRSYPRPVHLHLDQVSPPVRDVQDRHLLINNNKNISNDSRDLSSHDPNTSLNNYIHKLESLQARLKEQSKHIGKSR